MKHRSRASALPLHRLYVGEVLASASPMLLQTLLGSCVAACVCDRTAGVGGMNHILLPGEGYADDRPSRYGVHAMELLINAVLNAGGDRRRLVAKVFGGGNVVRSLQSTVGEQNIQFVRRFLDVEGIPLIAQRLGGTQAVELNFRTDTAKAIVRTVDGSRLQSIVSEENDYRSRVAHTQEGGNITLF